MTTPNAPTAIDALRARLADEDEYMIIRDLMIDRDAICLDDLSRNLRSLIDCMTADDRSIFALELSLCPYHMIDYAICFDDDDAECAAIRSCFPSHDT